MAAAGKSNVTPDRLMQFAWGYAPPLIIESACRYKLFDQLDAGPKTAEELSSAAGISLRGTRAIANALAGIDLLTKDAQGRYSLTPESATFLVSTMPSYLGRMICHTNGQILPRWQKLPEVVANGQPAAALISRKAALNFSSNL